MIFAKIKTDQGLHRAFVATVASEGIHWLIDMLLAFWIAAGLVPFWSISVGTIIAIILGIQLAHIAIETHDKYHRDENLLLELDDVEGV